MAAVMRVCALLLLVAPTAAHAHGGAGEHYRWATGGIADAVLGRSAVLPTGAPADVWTPDGQAVLSLPPRAVEGDDGEATVTVVAMAPWSLGALPTGLEPASNAYQIDAPLGRPATVNLATAHTAVAVFYSPDGQRWQPVPEAAADPDRVALVLPAPGFVLAAAEQAHGSVAGRLVEQSRRLAVPVALLSLLLLLCQRRVRRTAPRDPVGTAPGATGHMHDGVEGHPARSS